MRTPRIIKVGRFEVSDPDDPATRARLIKLGYPSEQASRLLNDTRKQLKRAAKEASK